MTRETRSVTTPSGKELVVKIFLTAGERNQLRGVYLAKMKLKADGTNDISSVDGSVVDQSEQKLLEVAAVSYDGIAENILPRLLESSPAEYDFVVGECSKANKGDLAAAK